MGFSLSLPIPGQPFASEGVKVGNDLSTISTWANGNIAGTDLAASAAIARSQLAGGFGNLAATSVGVNTSCVDGKFYIVTAGTTTMTLPTPTANATVGVIASSGQTAAAPTTVARSSGVINGLGVAGATSIALGTVGAYVVLLADGSNWNIVAGQQDTGWVAMALGVGITAFTTGYAAAARIIGNRVELSGSMKNNSGGALGASAQIATLPSAAYAPAQLIGLTAELSGASPTSSSLIVQAASTGLLANAAGIPNGFGIFLDSLWYRLS